MGYRYADIDYTKRKSKEITPGTSSVQNVRVLLPKQAKEKAIALIYVQYVYVYITLYIAELTLWLRYIDICR